MTTSYRNAQTPFRSVASPAVRGETASWSPRFLMFEYAYYGLIFYAILGVAVGISIPLLGAAGMAAVAALCVLRQNGAGSLRRALILPALFALSYVGVQSVFHQESVMDQNIRLFVTWGLSLVILLSLANRPGFLRRFSMFMVLVGILVLPFVEFRAAGGRLGLDASVGISNPNSLASWFGFCAVAFTIRGLEARRTGERWVSWVVGLLSVFIIGFTVSRATMASVAIALVIAVRKRLRRGFVPVLGLIGLLGIALVGGLFDGAIARFTERGLEETGRLVTWPVIVQRIQDAPWVGVGVSDQATYVPVRRNEVTPHNGLLFIALTSGVVPSVLFVALWIACFRGGLRAWSSRDPDSAYILPLLAYCFLVSMAASTAFMEPYVSVTLCMCIHHLVVRDHGSRVLQPPVSVTRAPLPRRSVPSLHGRLTR